MANHDDINHHQPSTNPVHILKVSTILKHPSETIIDHFESISTIANQPLSNIIIHN